MTAHQQTDAEVKELLDAIIRIVAMNNLQTIRRDDPVMVLPSVMKVMVDDFVKSYSAIIERHVNQHEEFALKCRLDAKDASERILNAALDAGRRQIAVSAADAAIAVADAIKNESDKALSRLREEHETVRTQTGPLVFAGGLMAFLGGVVALLAVFLGM